MASPVGHAIVGLTAAAVTARVTGAPPTPALWLGAFIASGVPDLDLVLSVVGLRGPRWHRNHSHALLVLAALAGGGWALLTGLGVDLDPRIYAAWTVALFSHPLLDYVTTGPYIGERGYGIPLFWPLDRRRRHWSRNLFDRDTGDWGEIGSLWELWWRVQPEVVGLGVPCAIVMLATSLL